MYQLVAIPNVVKRLFDNAFIPFDSANTDYQQYLTWLSEGNEPSSVQLPEPSVQLLEMPVQTTPDSAGVR